MSTETGAPPQAPEGFSVHGGDIPPAPEHDPGAPAHVLLGNHSLPVYPQSLPYLERRLGRTLTSFVGAAQEDQQDLNADTFFRFLGDGVYETLSVMVPALPRMMPEHEWHGFRSREQLDADRRSRADGGDGEDIPAENPGPTWAQIVAAGETVLKVNRFDILGSLGKLVDPTVLKATLTKRVQLELATRGLERQSSSPPPSGSDPKLSGTDPTTGSSGGSPSPGSSPSRPPTPSGDVPS